MLSGYIKLYENVKKIKKILDFRKVIVYNRYQEVKKYFYMEVTNY